MLNDLKHVEISMYVHKCTAAARFSHVYSLGIYHSIGLNIEKYIFTCNLCFKRVYIYIYIYIYRIHIGIYLHLWAKKKKKKIPLTFISVKNSATASVRMCISLFKIFCYVR